MVELLCDACLASWLREKVLEILPPCCFLLSRNRKNQHHWPKKSYFCVIPGMVNLPRHMIWDWRWEEARSYQKSYKKGCLKENSLIGKIYSSNFRCQLRSISQFILCQYFSWWHICTETTGGDATIKIKITQVNLSYWHIGVSHSSP